MVLSLLALAAVQTAQPAPTPAADQKPADKMECRNITEPGSRIPSRVCRLHSEWEQMAKATQDDVNSTRNGRGVGINPADPQ
jgi:hypothetical protein